MTIVYCGSLAGSHAELYCAKCHKPMDIVPIEMVSFLTLGGHSPLCMDCDADVADSVPDILWPAEDGEFLTIEVSATKRVCFEMWLPYGYPDCRENARPSFSVREIGWTEGLSSSPKVNRQKNRSAKTKDAKGGGGLTQLALNLGL